MILIGLPSFFFQHRSQFPKSEDAEVEWLGSPELADILLGNTGRVGGADIVPACAAAVIGSHHTVVPLWFVIADADDAIPFGVAQRTHVLLADLHLQIGGAHVVREFGQTGG